MSKTLIVNLFGGPGTGKSTTAAGVFHKLKTLGTNCEYIQEYAKDKTWEDNAFTLSCQPYISAKQLLRQHRILDKVDIAITDSPLLNGLIYSGHYTGENFDRWLLETFKSFNNLNIFLTRNLDKHPYNPAGRSQTLEQSQEIDEHIKALLEAHSIPYVEVAVSDDAHEHIIEIINKV
jgi:nicotinamide riboside kinase